jgi:phage gp29-like protein
MPGIIDQWGNPISSGQIARLRQHQAMPRMASPRQPFSTYHPTSGLTPASLASILSASSLGQSQQYMELLEEIEEKDLHYAAVLSTRKRQVAQLPVRVKAASEEGPHQEHADFIRRWLAKGALGANLFHMLDAVSKGYSVQEIIWQTEPGRVWPLRLVYRPQRYFEVDWRDGDTMLMRQNSGLAPLSLHKFMVHRHPSKSGLVLRSGLGRVALWAWMFKAYTQQDWATFAHNFGAPIRVGRYGPESSVEDRAVLWRAVTNIAGDMAAIIPRSMEVEFIEAKNAANSAELFEARCRYLDEQISKLVLGQTATTDANTGSHAAGRTHRLVQEDIERSDAAMVANTCNRQLIPQIVAFNFGPQDEYPEVEIGWPDEVPLAEVVDAVAKLGPLGLRVKASEIRDRLNLTPPEDAEAEEGAPAVEDVIGGRAPTPPAAPSPGRPGAAPMLRRLVQLQSQQPEPEITDALVARLAEDAAGVLHGLSDQVLAEIEAATDLADLGARIAALRLDPAELARVMGRSLALAQLVGEASIAEQVGDA